MKKFTEIKKECEIVNSTLGRKHGGPKAWRVESAEAESVEAESVELESADVESEGGKRGGQKELRRN